MPSFDIVSKVNLHEVTNAIDQTNRELTSRFDFKDTNAKVLQNKDMITLIAPSDFQLKQIDEIFCNKLGKRQVDIRILDYKDPEISLSEAKQEIKIKQGIEMDAAKKIIKMIKETSIKVQTAIQSDQIRVTGKKRDDLQEVISFLKKSKVELPLQFENFRE